MLPQLEIYTTKDEIKYVLFSQSEIISDEIRANGWWNKQILDIAASILSQSQKGGVVVDVGAGIGSFTVPLALTHQQHEFKSFEPLKVIFWQLCSNVLLNNLYNVRTFEKIVSDETTRKMYHDIDYAQYNNHGSFSFNSSINEIRGIVPINKDAKNPYHDVFNHRYEVVKIDDMTFNNVVLLKISAPGLESSVLKGAKETIELNSNPPLILELWSEDWYKQERAECLELLKQYGYKHIHDMKSHVIAFKTEEEYMISDSSLENNATYGGFGIIDQPNSVSDVLGNQKKYDAV